MEFVSQVRQVRFLRPSEERTEAIQSIEYRHDPLTGFVARINVARASRVRQAQSEESDLTEVIAHSRRDCVFCPESVDQATPRFPEDVWPTGRIARGETVVFPNLFPFAEHHAVGVLSLAHFIALDQFTVDMLVDSLSASQDYFRAVQHRYPSARYPIWIWNYLPPSAASVIHPHVQLLIDRVPSAGLRQMMVAGQRYYRRHGGNFWRDLVSTEADKGERLIHDDDRIAVLATYAPLGNRDVQIVVKDVSDLTGMTKEQMTALARAIVGVLRAYHAAGVNSFNVITYSGVIGRRSDHFWLTVRIVSRPRFQRYYTNDSGFMERFYGELVIETLPEDIALTFAPHLAAAFDGGL